MHNQDSCVVKCLSFERQGMLEEYLFKDISHGFLFLDWYRQIHFSDTVLWLPFNLPLQTKNVLPKIRDQQKCQVLAV